MKFLIEYDDCEASKRATLSRKNAYYGAKLKILLKTYADYIVV